MTVEFVFFDAGETLLSPKPSWSELTVTKLAERGHEVTVEQMREAWRLTGKRFTEASEQGVNISASNDASHTFWTTLYRDQMALVGVDDPELPQLLYEVFSDPHNYGLFPDAVPALDALRARGLRLGVISNFDTWLGTMLEVLAVTEHFEVVAISGELGVEKPDPKIFHWALEQAGVEPSRAMHVGDSPNFDAQPAHDLGMKGVLLDRHGRWSDLDVPYPIVSSLSEIASLI